MATKNPDPTQADAEPGRVTADPGATELRQVSDARTMRALAHPVRMALLEVLSLGDALTATEVGERIGESPTTCSFHLRQLAKYGFVEEAGGGKGRARPWRMSTIGLRFRTAPDDPEAQLAVGALFQMFQERQQDRHRAWQASKASYPLRWREAARDMEFMLYLTAEELEQFNDEIAGMLMSRFLDRSTDPSRRPAGALPVETIIMSYPISNVGDDRLPGAGQSAGTPDSANQKGDPS
jgi:DNA-binding transcriptional ArsR family regulator